MIHHPFLLALLPTVIAQAPLVPIIPGTKPAADFKFQLGAWLYAPDTPGSFNKKLGYNMASFQAALSIPYRVNATGTYLDPLPEEFSFTHVVSNWDDNTDASVLMTIYADQLVSLQGPLGMDLVTDEAIQHLAVYLAKIPVETGRKVYMRWLPEMNGDWMWYGRKNVEYVALWKRMFPIFRKYAPGVVIVWSPNFDLPYGDTSYWPGVEYVDMIGTSVYYKGFGFNNAMPSDYITKSISPVYVQYAQKYNLPFMISECSGAWESGPGKDPASGALFTSVTNTINQPTFQKIFWQGILAPEVFAAFPLLTMAYIFEVAKLEEFYSDFRIANDTAVLAAFKQVVASVDSAGYLSWANRSTFVKPVSSSSSNTITSVQVATAAPTQTKSNGFQAIFDTVVSFILPFLV